jgi:hypothetical protein
MNFRTVRGQRLQVVRREKGEEGRLKERVRRRETGW